MEFKLIVQLMPFWLIIFNLARGNHAGLMGEKSIDLKTFDASEVTWAHAVNSRRALEKELTGTVDFLEADVSLGLLDGLGFGTSIPIMAHPPNTTSDISLAMWLEEVVNRQSDKGIKLDFKSLEVVEPALRILRQYADKLNSSSLWLNADILYGPVHSTTTPVKDDMFLLLCNQLFPNATVSVGWTTNWSPNFPRETWYYEWKHIVKMADTIRCFGYERHYPPLTFPIRGIYASRSIRQLQWLLGVVPGSSLTVWSSQRDPLDVSDLVKIRRSFPASQVYYDVPEEIRLTFLQSKNTTSYVPEKKSSFRKEQWMTLTHGVSSHCSHYTYISNSTIVFGQTLTTVSLLKIPQRIDDQHGLEIEGRIRFFGDYDTSYHIVPGNNVVKIVLVDVSLFSKNTSSEALDLTESDTNVLWSAVNASELYSFHQNVSDRCRMFRLDTEADRIFQAWTVSCNPNNDEMSFDEVVENGLQEVPYGKRVVLPTGPFMVGFVSSGEGHAVIHDFEIRGKERKVVEFASSAYLLKSAVFGIFIAIFVSLTAQRFLSG